MTLRSQGLKCYFHVVRDKSSRHQTYDYKEILQYADYLALVQGSRAILDLIQYGQSGLTLRPLEALCLEKKLITNNKRVKSLDF